MQRLTEKKKLEKVHVLCNVCGEDLGEDRTYYAEEHLKKYPNHLSYRGSDITF